MTMGSKAVASLAAIVLVASIGCTAGCAQQRENEPGDAGQEQQDSGPDIEGVSAGLQIESPDGEVRTYMVREGMTSVSWSEGEGESSEAKAQWKITFKDGTPSAVLGKSKVYTLNEKGKNKTVTSKGYKLRWIAHDKLAEEIGPAADAANGAETAKATAA